jgi:hypothetical protein
MQVDTRVRKLYFDKNTKLTTSENRTSEQGFLSYFCNTFRRLKHDKKLSANFNAKTQFYDLTGSTKTICYNKYFNSYRGLSEFKSKEIFEVDEMNNIKCYESYEHYLNHEKGITEYCWKKQREREYFNGIRTDNIKRSVEAIFNIAMLNKFKWFVTLTFNPKLVNPKDPDEIINKLNIFLKNKVQRNNLEYVFTAEYHKLGGIHLHGFINGNFNYIKSKYKSGKLRYWKGKQVYNVEDWGYGWSTAVELDDNVLASSTYITKYITKENVKIFNKFYLAGGNIKRHPDIFYFNLDFENAKAKAYTIVEQNMQIKYLDDYQEFDYNLM